MRRRRGELCLANISNISFDPSFLFCCLTAAEWLVCWARELLVTNLHFHFFTAACATRPAFGETWPLASASAVIGGAPQESGFSAWRSLSVIVLSLSNGMRIFGERCETFQSAFFSTFHAKSPHKSLEMHFWHPRREWKKTCVCAWVLIDFTWTASSDYFVVCLWVACRFLSFWVSQECWLYHLCKILKQRPNLGIQKGCWPFITVWTSMNIWGILFCVHRMILLKISCWSNTGFNYQPNSILLWSHRKDDTLSPNCLDLQYFDFAVGDLRPQRVRKKRCCDLEKFIDLYKVTNKHLIRVDSLCAASSQKHFPPWCRVLFSN